MLYRKHFLPPSERRDPALTDFLARDAPLNLRDKGPDVLAKTWERLKTKVLGY